MGYTPDYIVYHELVMTTKVSGCWGLAGRVRSAPREVVELCQKASSQPFSSVPTRHIHVICTVMFVPFPVFFPGSCVGHIWTSLRSYQVQAIAAAEARRKGYSPSQRSGISKGVEGAAMVLEGMPRSWECHL